MKYVLILILVLTSSIAFAQKVMIYGGENHDVYLGCITCTQFNGESIWNAEGIYGTKNNNLSIWSEFSEYGNEFSYLSPWNEYATKPPILVDENGGYYGYFTRNAYFKDRTEVEFFVYVLNNFRWIQEHFEEYVKGLYF
jgi:hypothetical protein